MSSWLPKLLCGILVAVLVLSIVVALILLLAHPTPEEASSLQSVTTSILIPVFQGILTALVTAGIIKGTLVAINNPRLPDTQKQQIEFLVW